MSCTSKMERFAKGYFNMFETIEQCKMQMKLNISFKQVLKLKGYFMQVEVSWTVLSFYKNNFRQKKTFGGIRT